MIEKLFNLSAWQIMRRDMCLNLLSFSLFAQDVIENFFEKTQVKKSTQKGVRECMKFGMRNFLIKSWRFASIHMANNYSLWRYENRFLEYITNN